METVPTRKFTCRTPIAAHRSISSVEPSGSSGSICATIRKCFGADFSKSDAQSL